MARLEEWLPRAARLGVQRAQNPAYRPALPLECDRAGVSLWDAGPFSFRFSFRYRAAPAQAATMSNECVSSAVFAIMIDAEQYLSCDRLIARSTVAGFRLRPVTVK